MKTVARTLLFTTLSLSAFGTAAFAAPQTEVARILDMFAVREADVYIVHIIADGDISEFSSALERRESTYKLTLDVPALPPIDTRYEVETPFSRRFQVWPMQLEKKIYSRVEIELDTEASSVVGVLDASHLFVRIQREGAIVASAPEADPVSTRAETTTPEPIAEEPIAPEADPEPAPPTAVAELATPKQETPFSEDSEDEARNTDVTGLEPGDEELFLNLFPKPAGGDQQTLFNIMPIVDGPRQDVRGIRLGRFALAPSLTASYVRGSNLLLQSEDVLDDSALLVQGHIVASLLDSLNTLKLMYEGRYRDFEIFELEQRYTHVFDINTSIDTSPRSTFAISNHFVHGSFENREFDPGGEVVGNTDPFYRNFTDGTFSMDFSERLGAEISGSFNRVAFLEPDYDYFSYDASSLGGAVVYHLSPLSSIVGEYASTRTRPDLARPEAASDGNLVLVGLRGEITALISGHIRAGYASQTFTKGATPQSFRGFVADGRLIRQFGTETTLVFGFGRRTNPSAFQENGFYTSNYGTARFVAPIIEKMRFTVAASYYGNRYPLSDVATDSNRLDRSLSSAVGVSYFFTPLSYFSIDYRHDRRHSSLERLSYRNNAVQLMIGFGFLNR